MHFVEQCQFHRSFGSLRDEGAGMREILIGVLVAAVAILGYLYYQETRSDVSIKLTAPKIETPTTK
jgi:hypothetical protein